MPFVKCAKHGRVYDNAKDDGCPLCLQEASMPRAPGGAAAPKTTNPEEAAAKGRMVLMLLLLGVVLGAGGFFWYRSRHPPVSAQQAAYDSMRALAAEPRIDTTRFVDPSDLSPIRRARALRASLGAMLSANRATILGFAGGPVDTAVADRAAQRRALAYAAFARRWHERLDALTREGADFRYAPGTRMGPQMENVTNYLGAAISVMRDMVRPLEVKPRAERQADLAAAGGYLNSAGTVLSNLPR